MLEGHLSPRLEPLITLTLRNSQGHNFATEAVVDTGFNDFITLSAEIIDALALELVSSINIELADGTIRETNYYPLYVEWLGESRFVMGQDGGDTPLVGMMLLLDCELCITVRYEGVVTIKPA